MSLAFDYPLFFTIRSFKKNISFLSQNDTYIYQLSESILLNPFKHRYIKLLHIYLVSYLHTPTRREEEDEEEGETSPPFFKPPQPHSLICATSSGTSTSTALVGIQQTTSSKSQQMDQVGPSARRALTSGSLWLSGNAEFASADPGRGGY